MKLRRQLQKIADGNRTAVIQRSIALYDALSGDRWWTPAELSILLEVHIRTLYRYLQAIESVVPIERKVLEGVGASYRRFRANRWVGRVDGRAPALPLPHVYPGGGGPQ